MTLKQRIGEVLMEQTQVTKPLLLRVREGETDETRRIIQGFFKGAADTLEGLLSRNNLIQNITPEIFEGTECEVSDDIDTRMINVQIPENELINPITASELKGIINRALIGIHVSNDILDLRESDEYRLIPNGSRFCITIGEEVEVEDELMQGISGTIIETDLQTIHINVSHDTPLRSFLAIFLDWLQSESVQVISTFRFGTEGELHGRMNTGE